MQSMRAEDVALLCAEPDGAQLQIGALCFFDAAPLRDRRGRVRLAALRSHVASQLDAVPRFRQRIAPTWADLAAPVWVDDTDFDLARHTPLVTLPAPGGPAALRTFLDRLLSEPMDVAHPLWDIHVVDGYDDDVIAVVVRAHHVMADGLALYDAATLLLSAAPSPPRRTASHWTPQPEPAAGRRNAIALLDRAGRRIALASAAIRQVLDPRRAVANARFAAQAVRSVPGARLPIAPSLAITGPVGTRRAFAWDTLPMSDIIAVKRACDATVNDVVLAIVTGALRAELDATDCFDPSGPEPRALVPIGSTDRTDPEPGNRFSITSVALPVAVDDPLERVGLIHARMHQRPASPATSLLPHLFSVADLVPIPALRVMAPWALRRQPLVNLAVSNIPGSREPLYLGESRLLGLHPFITGVGNMALIVGVLSYADTLGVGITVDPDVAGDPARIVEHMRRSAIELARLAR